MISAYRTTLMELASCGWNLTLHGKDVPHRQQLCVQGASLQLLGRLSLFMDEIKSCEVRKRITRLARFHLLKQ